ncbi:MAG: hypothetical protein KKB51_05245 [Candidatus Riflebacteria bacterium]|nr:hypothetical protein [Candidatus Riflebacteria bacterium]
MLIRILNLKYAVLLFLTLFLLPGPIAKAQIIVSGNITSNLPTKLNINDSFSLLASESAIFRFPNGTVINLMAPSEGTIASEGLNFKQSACFIKFKNLSDRFIVKTNLAAMAGKDCQFFLQSNQKVVKVVIMKGKLKVLTRDSKTFQISAGETILLSENKIDSRKSENHDTAFWKKNPATQLDDVKNAGKSPKRFGELYIYSMAILEKGGGTVFFSDPDRKPESAENKEVFAKAGARIITSASETARLRLGEKTLIKISPDSEILLKPAHLEIVKGECLIRHGNTLFPVKVVGPMPFLITHDSSIEIARTDESMLITIQKGSLLIPSTDQQLAAGLKFNLSSNGLQPVNVGVIPESIMVSNNAEKTTWGSGRDLLNEILSDNDPFLFTDETSHEQPDSIQQQNTPGSLLQQYEIRPEKERK